MKPGNVTAVRHRYNHFHDDYLRLFFSDYPGYELESCIKVERVKWFEANRNDLRKLLLK